MALSRIAKLKIMAGLTGSFFLVEIIVGYISGSVALVADSFHMLSDLIAIIIGIIAIKVAAETKRTPHHSYGWERAEVLGAFTNAIFLLTLCFTIFAESMKRFFDPGYIENPFLVLYVGIIGLVMNLGAMFLFGHDHHGHSHDHGDDGHSHDHTHDEHHEKEEMKRYSHTEPQPPFTPIAPYYQLSARVTQSAKSMKSYMNQSPRILSSHEEDVYSFDDYTVNQDYSHGHDHESHDSDDNGKNKKKKNKKKKDKGHANHDHDMNMRGVFLHVLGDALGSVAVIIGAVINIIFPWNYDPSRNWVLYIDPAVSLIIAGIITYVTIPLLKSSAYILLQSVPMNIPVQTIKDRISNLPGVLGVHELHIWQLAQGKYVATVHVLLRKHSNMIESHAKSPLSPGAKWNSNIFCMQISHEIRDIMHNFGIHSTTIQPEFIEPHSDENFDKCIFKCVSDECLEKQCCHDKIEDSKDDAKDHEHDHNHEDHEHYYPEMREIQVDDHLHHRHSHQSLQ